MDLRQALLGGAATVALGVGLLASPVEVDAQSTQGVIVTQSASKADAATFYAQSAVASACTTVAAAVANLTITISPPAGNYVYLTGFYLEYLPNATAANSATVWTSTNLNGTPSWLANVNASSASVPTTEFLVAEIYPTAVKSLVAGTPVTILPTATSASTFQCAHAVGYFNPT